MAHITANTSVDQLSGDAFVALIGGDLIVDANAFLISRSNGFGASLDGSWTVTINGEVGSQSKDGINITGISADFSTVTVGAHGNVFGGATGIKISEKATIVNHGIVQGLTGGIAHSNGDLHLTNSGTIKGLIGVTHGGPGTLALSNTGIIEGTGPFAISSTSQTTITNAGHVVGNVMLSLLNDTFVDSTKIGGVLKGGTVSGIIDLNDGLDKFFGGSSAETVRDGPGDDVYKLGGGNDTFLGHMANMGVDGIDNINAGSGIDTYDASTATNAVNINLDDVPHVFFFAHQATGDVGSTDNIVGFENAIGGAGADVLLGSKGANQLSGNGGADIIEGFTGRDILSGGANNDTFVFEKLSDSGVKASTRDVITDFSVGDEIGLAAIDANGSAAGDGTFNLIGFENFHHQRGELREVFSGNNTILSGDANGDGKADFSIVLVGHHFLTGADINL